MIEYLKSWWGNWLSNAKASYKETMEWLRVQ